MSRRISEDHTRKEMIDPQLERADWYLREHKSVFTRANQLSTLPKDEAWCRLIHKPEDGRRPKLIGLHIVTENLTDRKGNPDLASQVMKNSRKLANQEQMSRKK